VRVAAVPLRNFVERMTTLGAMSNKGVGEGIGLALNLRGGDGGGGGLSSRSEASGAGSDTNRSDVSSDGGTSRFRRRALISLLFAT
jgi:hypothetical protein